MKLLLENFQILTKTKVRLANIQTPDALLVQNYVAGDENAFSYIDQRHESRIYIYSKISDRDISNDIFKTLYKSN
jgi:RNA polymerase sigma-70 factor (ECF subfamily)